MGFKKVGWMKLYSLMTILTLFVHVLYQKVVKQLYFVVISFHKVTQVSWEAEYVAQTKQHFFNRKRIHLLEHAFDCVPHYKKFMDYSFVKKCNL